MRPGPLSLLFAALLLPAYLHAEESLPQAVATTSEQAQIDDLEQRLATSEQQRETLNAELQAANGERESAQLLRLRQDNQRLKLQLKKAQAEAPERLFSEQQMWFAVGAGAGLLGVMVGAMLRGNRRSRREWIN
ncbi:translation initiation factor 2 [Pseudomonas sp. UBA2684]|uniref:translation initiation factor 2 n=1 Tax=Pseudomonas sp. UBA2684 TaxID=1947311 RepID=UPI000E8A90FB|nr:translation initiation factor 2 [Pseudomonas sp. UBA2684]HBX55990.1 translation initiation factor 2 [Pseudomonas sp.]|tara:strand:+ start:45 stop:446 length:402 start_codon:yes stop_codon:yes gene_type:complete